MAKERGRGGVTGYLTTFYQFITKMATAGGGSDMLKLPFMDIQCNWDEVVRCVELSFLWDLFVTLTGAVEGKRCGCLADALGKSRRTLTWSRMAVVSYKDKMVGDLWSPNKTQ